jgi:hypothetical protein
MSFDIPPFILRLTLDSKIYAIEVTQTFLSDKMEIFTLTYKQRTLLMLSNRPFIRGKNLNKKRIEWKAIDGKVKYQSSLEKIKEELESYIKKIEKPRINWKDNPKNQPY